MSCYYLCRASARILGEVQQFALDQLSKLCEKAKASYGNDISTWSQAQVQDAGVALGKTMI